MRHRNDVVVHRRRLGLHKLAPGLDRRAQRKGIASLSVDRVIDALDRAVLKMRDADLVAELEHHARVEMSAEQARDDVVIDRPLPALDPILVEFGHRGILLMWSIS